ncbi:MAG: YdcF family protein, partial [Eubacterium sp.]|nr:YdcF family protein [Eubacterium sp.]
MLILILLIASLGGVAVMTLNSEVENAEKENILYAVTDEEAIPPETIDALKALKAECILVLGCGIRDKETPTPMLRDRLETAVMLYKAGVAPKVLLTGDNGTLVHNEIHVMLKYMHDAGIPDADIFCDHAGFSTYDS